MSIRSTGQGHDGHDTTAEATDESTVGRRRLLGGAAGGLVLTASGLFLPDWLEETEAREGALGGARGGRHGKNHRRRRKRTHGDKKKKGKNPPQPGFALIDGIRWGYYSEAGLFPIEFWGEVNRGWEMIDARVIPNEEFVELRTKDLFAALWIKGRYFIGAWNIFGIVSVTMGYGGSMVDPDGWRGGTRVFNGNLAEYQLAQDVVMDGLAFTVERLQDDSDYKKLSLTIRTA